MRLAVAAVKVWMELLDAANKLFSPPLPKAPLFWVSGQRAREKAIVSGKDRAVGDARRRISQSGDDCMIIAGRARVKFWAKCASI